MGPSGRTRGIALALAWPALACLTPALRAQVVRGTVTAAGTGGGGPVENAIVVLLDGGGVRRAATLSDEAGRFALRAPAAGAYVVRLERIGYRNVTSAPFVLREGETVERQLEASVVPVALAAIEVTGRDKRCVVRPGEGEATARVWAEARKALEATRVAQDQRRVQFTILRIVRDVSSKGSKVLGERQWTLPGVIGETPFVSAPAESLDAHGYVRPDGDSVTYYAPDAAVLLSDLFADSHCMRLVKGGGDHAGLLGLGFEPAERKRELPDVKGVLWLDARTAALRRLEFGYEHLDPEVAEETAGGTIEFGQLPTGVWIVERWTLRMPVLAMETRRDEFGEQPPIVRLLRIREVGGVVTEARALPRVAPPAPPR